MTNPQRDAHLEQWLRRPSTASDIESAECLDAETLAAMVDDGLGAAERDRAMTHAAGCARCQSVLAALGQTVAVPATVPAVKDAAPLSWLWRWLAPAVAAATAVVALAVWVRTPVPSSRSSSVTEQTAPSPTDAGTPPVAAGATDSRADSASRQQPEVPAPVAAPAPSSEARAVAPAPVPRAAISAPPQTENFSVRSAPASPEQPRAADKLAAADSALSGRAGAAPPAVPPVTTPPSVGAAATAAVTSAQPAAPPAAPAAPATGTVTRPEAAPLRRAQERVDAGSPAAALSESVQLAPAWTLVSPPDGSMRWRFAGDRVEASSDSGTTWRAVATGPIARIRAGSSPSARVCWLVGQSGLVLRTTDGEAWQRVAFSAAVDLTAVAAADASAARVTTADGRVFVTADAGRTWTIR